MRQNILRFRHEKHFCLDNNDSDDVGGCAKRKFLVVQNSQQKRKTKVDSSFIYEIFWISLTITSLLAFTAFFFWLWRCIQPWSIIVK